MLDEARSAQGGGALAGDATIWNDVVGVLQRCNRRIDAESALTLLPKTLPLQAALPYLRGALKGTQEQRRGLAVVRNLWRGMLVGFFCFWFRKTSMAVVGGMVQAAMHMWGAVHVYVGYMGPPKLQLQGST